MIMKTKREFKIREQVDGVRPPFVAAPTKAATEAGEAAPTVVRVKKVEKSAPTRNDNSPPPPPPVKASDVPWPPTPADAPTPQKD